MLFTPDFTFAQENNHIGIGETAERNPEKAQTLSERAMKKFRSGDLDNAISLYKKASKYAPEDTSVLVNLGSLYFRKTNYEKAESSYRDVLSLDPDHPYAHYYLGVSLFKQSDFTEAKKHLTEVSDHRELSSKAERWHKKIDKIGVDLPQDQKNPKNKQEDSDPIITFDEATMSNKLEDKNDTNPTVSQERNQKVSSELDSTNQWERSLYAGIALNRFRYDESGEVLSNDIDFSTSFFGLQGRLGIEINPLMSGEIRGGFSQEGNGNVVGVNSTIEVKNYISGLIIFSPFINNETYKPYLLGGVTSGTVETCVGSNCVANSGTEAAYGLGLQTKLSDNDNKKTELDSSHFYIEWGHFSSGSSSGKNYQSDFKLTGLSFGLMGKY